MNVTVVGGNSSPLASDAREHPVDFTAGEIRATIAGRKTQFRRIVTPQPTRVSGMHDWNADAGDVVILQGRPVKLVESRGRNKRNAGELTPQKIPCPAGSAGDRLWVRETWSQGFYEDGGETVEGRVRYKATEPSFDGRWQSGRFMPRNRSRLSLEVVSVKVNRLQEIGEYDIEQEGIVFCVGDGTPGDGLMHCHMRGFRSCFAEWWDGLNLRSGFAWRSNPWVWTIEFKHIETSSRESQL